jgi:S-DNA-T family DNA segregation ATPase FtsK/SpoIIIE
VRLGDPMISRQHARLAVSDVVEIVDLGSANGVALGDADVTRMVLRPDDVVRLGDTLLSVRVVRPTGATAGAESTSVAFVRSPRLDPRYSGLELEAPEIPERPQAQRFPLIALLAPLLMGAVLYLVTRSVTSLLFVGLSPLLLLGNALEQRLGGRAAYKRAVAQLRADVELLVGEARAGEVAERAARLRENPSTAECVDAARGATPLLWCRRPADHGFLELRLGTGRRPSRTVIELASVRRAPRDLAAELAAAVAPFAGIDGVPVLSLPLVDGATGVAGPRWVALAAARALLLQLAVLHSPAELTVAGVASSSSARDWEWLKWLPHTSSPHSPVGGARLLASNAVEAAAVVSELEDLLARRAADDSRAGGPSVPAVVLLVEADAPVEHSRLVELAELGWAHGVHVLWVAADRTLLPAACRTFLDVSDDPARSVVGYVRDGGVVEPVVAEVVDLATATDVARRMSALVDAGARVDDDSDLPRSVSVFALPGRPLAPAAEEVLERWLENRSVVSGPRAPVVRSRRAGSLRAVIGQSAAGVHSVDLRTDGPHALVGGTTGSGKSELLQAWILGMASAHSPQRVTFLLVDYKGGSAFRDCVALPHTVGMVTDLSPHLVRRALTSLNAELRYREHVLAAHKAKDLLELERRGEVDAPPSLVIVVDEFAALVNEVPEFVDGMVNVAQRGRSLGLHLILATQRPAGVIKDNLRANTNLRMALRMADEDDSTDVLGSPQAAGFDPELAGRAVVKTGPGRLVPFQTAYAGGWTSSEPAPPAINVEELAFGSGPRWVLPDPEEAVVDDLGPTDIQRLVSAATAASELAELPAPRIPWLPELKGSYDLSDLPTRRRDDVLVFGLRDDPDNQAQPTVSFNPDRDGNLVVYGTGGSGKSTLLRSLAVAAGFTVRGGPCQVYGLDFGARGLAMLEDLPHVGSVIPGGDHERIVRLISTLRSLVDERALSYSRVNAATITDYRRIAGAPDEPRILLLVDGIAAFRQAYESPDRIRWFEAFTSLAADGRPVGVHVVLSSDQRSGMTTALAAAVQRRVVLRLASADDYSIMGVASDVLSSDSPPGRGILDDAEIQVAVLGTATDGVAQAVAVRGFGASMSRAGARQAPPVLSVPEHVRLEDLPATVDGRPVIGIASSTLGPATVDPRGVFLVSGPPGSGRSTAVHSLASAVARAHPSTSLHWFGMRRSPTSDLPFWASTSLGAAQCQSGAAALREVVAQLQPEDDPVVVVLENLTDFAGTDAENDLVELVGVCGAADVLVIADGETSALSGYGQLMGVVKNSRTGLALQPDQGDGLSLYKTPFPRTTRADFPPGRALLVARGATEVVQVGASAPSGSA